MGKGWDGICGPAIADGNGRSGGTAVLTRRPTQIVRGGALMRRTIAVVSWTRRNRPHIGSIYNDQASYPARIGATTQAFDEWHEYLAGLRGMPWILGGDWNLELQEVTDDW